MRSDINQNVSPAKDVCNSQTLDAGQASGMTFEGRVAGF